MATDFANGHIPPDLADPSINHPEHVNGFVDMNTLVDIQRYLGQSEKSDDSDLATWIKDQYLQEPLLEIGRPIRDTEGFVKLDAAYRRVRQLTGKAQDEWPFFDKNWKKMTSTAVKSIVLGDAAMGTNCSVTTSGFRDSPMSNGSISQNDSASYGPRLEVPIVRENPSHHQVQPQTSSQLASTAPVSQPESEPKAQRQGPEPSTPKVAASSAVSEHDVLAGKVRGPLGRFVNKSESPRAAMKGPRIKYVKKSRTRAALEDETEEDSQSNDEEVRAPKALSHIESISGGEVDMSGSSEALTASEAIRDMQMAISPVNASPTSSTLAAEAEAILSNLDRLPPGLVGKKRKSESATQRGGSKRGRGSRGGVLGRPRKSEPVVVSSQSPADEDRKTTRKKSPEPEPVTKATTRRSSRMSVVSAPEPPNATEATDGHSTQEVHQQQTSRRTKVLVNGVDSVHIDEDMSSSGSTAAPGLADEIANETANGVHQNVSVGKSPAIQAATSASRVSKAQTTPSSTKRKKRVSFSPGPEAGNVEVYARISTITGFQDIYLSQGDIASELNLVKRYAAWQKSKTSNVTFEVFREIAAELMR